MSEFKSWLYENDIVYFVLKGAENLPARRRKTEEKLYFALTAKSPFAALSTVMATAAL
jgi:hypothetical protein